MTRKQFIHVLMGICPGTLCSECPGLNACRARLTYNGYRRDDMPIDELLAETWNKANAEQRDKMLGAGYVPSGMEVV